MRSTRRNRERVVAAWSESTRTGEPYRGEFRFRRPDREVRLVLVTARTLSDDVGRVGGFVGCVNDITELRQLEHEREEFFELALDLLAAADLDSGFLRVSRSFEQTLGWTRKELVRAIVEPMEVLSSAPRVGVSIGIALWPEDGRSAASLLVTADRAMYRNKRDVSAADAA